MKRKIIDVSNRPLLIKLLSEESRLFCSYLKFFLFLNIGIAAVYGCIAISAVLSPALYTNRSGNFLIESIIYLFFSSSGSSGFSSPVLIVLSSCAMLVRYFIAIYILWALLCIFRKISRGETPFTEKNAGLWKNCSRIFAVLAVISFFSCFILRAASIIIMISFMIIYLFFHSLELIFLYGTGLQSDSDETL